MRPTTYRLAIAGTDHHIHVLDPATGQSMMVTEKLGSGMAYDWPTWSPDGGSIAFVGSTAPVAGERPVARLFVADLGAGPPREVYSEPGVNPFYLAWSPDNTRIAFLAGSEGGLALRAVPAKGGAAFPWSVEGQPDFFAWHPDGNELLLHVGGAGTNNPEAFIGRVNAETGAIQRLTLPPADFRTPVWSPDGRRMLVATQAQAGQVIASMDAQGEGETLTLYSGRAAFLWSPNGVQAAALVTPPNPQAPGGGLYLIDVKGREDRRLSDDQNLAFWWSPAGGRIATLHTDPVRQHLVLTVIDVDKGARLRLASLTPSEPLLLTLSFFDQYALSASFWSPDGRYLVYTGHTYREQLNGHQRHSEQPHVFVVATDGSEAPRDLGQGQLAVFAPV